MLVRLYYPNKWLYNSNLKIKCCFHETVLGLYVHGRLNEDQIIFLVPSPRQNPVYVACIQGNNLLNRLFQIRFFMESLFSMAFVTTTYLVMMSQTRYKNELDV